MMAVVFLFVSILHVTKWLLFLLICLHSAGHNSLCKILGPMLKSDNE